MFGKVAYGYAIVSPNLVKSRSYFLKIFKTPDIIWTIRVILIAVAIIAVIVYIKMKKNSKNGE